MSHAPKGGQAPDQASSGRQTGAAAHAWTVHSEGTHDAASHQTSHTRHGDNQAGNCPRPTNLPSLTAARALVPVAVVPPGYSAQRPKNPMSHASGLHERARMYKPAFARIHRSFGYHLHEPVRRDFSVLLTQCGNDLDLAIAQASARLDYSPREHARDLAGAARWNATSRLDTSVASRTSSGSRQMRLIMVGTK